MRNVKKRITEKSETQRQIQELAIDNHNVSESILELLVTGLK